MTREQKQALAAIVIDRIATLVEFWQEEVVYSSAADILDDVPQEEINNQLSVWLGKLPGTTWDSRLPPPPPRR